MNAQLEIIAKIWGVLLNHMRLKIFLRLKAAQATL